MAIKIETSQEKLEQAMILLDEIYQDNMSDIGLEGLLGDTALIMELSVDELGKLRRKFHAQIIFGGI